MWLHQFRPITISSVPQLSIDACKGAPGCKVDPGWQQPGACALSPQRDLTCCLANRTVDWAEASLAIGASREAAKCRGDFLSPSLPGRRLIGCFA